MAGFGKDTQRVPEAGEESWRHRGRVPQFVEPSGKHEEAADEVATVDRGDVARGERCKRVDVVPVEQVTTVPLEAAERIERVADAADELRDGAPAKVAGSQIGEQSHRDVGGTGAGCHDQLAVHLHVVGWEPIGMGRHIFLEVPPGAPSGRGQELLLRARESDGPRRQRQTDPPGDERREQPCHEPGTCSHEHVRMTRCEENRGQKNGHQRADGHRANETG